MTQGLVQSEPQRPLVLPVSIVVQISGGRRLLRLRQAIVFRWRISQLSHRRRISRISQLLIVSLAAVLSMTAADRTRYSGMPTWMLLEPERQYNLPASSISLCIGNLPWGGCNIFSILPTNIKIQKSAYKNKKNAFQGLAT